MGDALTRAEEIAFGHGFDAGIAHQKKAAPSPKAKQYRDEAIAARADLANLRARVNAVVVRLLSDVSPRPIETAIEKLQDALAEPFTQSQQENA